MALQHGTIEYRSFDGSGNNLSDPDVNAAGTGFLRLGVVRFADGMSTLVGGPNPRMISATMGNTTRHPR